MNLNDLISSMLPLHAWITINVASSLSIAAMLLWMLLRGFDLRSHSYGSRLLSYLLRAVVWGVAIAALGHAGSSVTSGAAALPIHVAQNMLFAAVMVWVVISHEKFVDKN